MRIADWLEKKHSLKFLSVKLNYYKFSESLFPCIMHLTLIVTERVERRRNGTSTAEENEIWTSTTNTNWSLCLQNQKIAPIIRALSTPPKTAFDDNTFNTVPIPNCAILANPNEYSEKEIDNARVRVIRLTMDSLITKCGDRPTELELIHLAKSIATQYSILRDDPGLPVRDNYVSNMGLAHTQWFFYSH